MMPDADPFLDLFEENFEEQMPPQKAQSMVRLSISAPQREMPVAALANHSWPRLLSLELDEELGDPEPSCDHKTDRLWDVAPQLEKLTLRAERPLFHSLRLPHLKSLNIQVAPVCLEGRWELPSLVSLDYDPHIESQVDTQDLSWLWEQTLPALRALFLRGSFVAQEPLFATSLAQHFIAQLERLWVPTNAIVVDPAITIVDQLLEQESSLRHLKEGVVTNAEGYSAGDLDKLRKHLPQFRLVS
jgi:hypothetical protein